MGAPTVYERELADILCARFPAIDQIRFCNCGTEANLLALGTARVLTGRNKVLVFNGGYHGSVINFPAGAAKLNAPFDFILAEYNDTEGVEKEIRAAADDLAALIDSRGGFSARQGSNRGPIPPATGDRHTLCCGLWLLGIDAPEEM